MVQAIRAISPAQRNTFLPDQGHFQIVILIQPMETTAAVQVTARGYIHTRYGKAKVQKMKQQMPGEIGRTNRKWRRKLQREKPSEAMDQS